MWSIKEQTFKDDTTGFHFGFEKAGAENDPVHVLSIGAAGRAVKLTFGGDGSFLGAHVEKADIPVESRTPQTTAEDLSGPGHKLDLPEYVGVQGKFEDVDKAQNLNPARAPKAFSLE